MPAVRNRVLLAVVPIAFALNAWLGDRVKVGRLCPVLTSPSATAASAPATDPGACARQCPVRVEPRATALPVS